MRYLLLPVWIILIVFGIAFSSINAYRVPIHLYVINLSIYLPLLLLFVFFLGIVCGSLLFMGKVFRLRLLNRQVSRSLKQCEQEVR